MILRQTPSVPEMSQSEGERVEGVPFTVIALRRATPGSSVSTFKKFNLRITYSRSDNLSLFLQPSNCYTENTFSAQPVK